MQRRWTRRGLLAALAAAAGCTGGSGDETTATTASTSTATRTTSSTIAQTTATTETTERTTTTTEPVDVREWPDEYYQGPLVSAHEHMTGSDNHWMDHETMDWLVRWMDRNRVAQMMAITSDVVLSPVREHDDRLVPFAHPYVETHEHFDELASVLEERLDDNPEYVGLGEFGLKGRLRPDGSGILLPDHPEMLKVYDLAAERDLPIMLHAAEPWRYPDPKWSKWETFADVPVKDALANAYSYNRDTTFLVHGSYHWRKVPNGELVADAFDNHPNLYYDISPIAPYAHADYGGNPTREKFEAKMAETGVEHHAQNYFEEHAAILEEYSDRVLWGMDAALAWHFNDWALDTFVDVSRSLLGRLPEEDARNVGYRTAEQLFGIAVETDA